jgi:hypothetical protein
VLWSKLYLVVPCVAGLELWGLCVYTDAAAAGAAVAERGELAVTMAAYIRTSRKGCRCQGQSGARGERHQQRKRGR